MGEVSASEELARLAERSSQARGRIDELERSWRDANQALAKARADLIQLERRGGSASERNKLENALAEAEATAAQPWRERVEGARQAARDVDAERQRFIGEHLGELVEAKEADGRAAAERFNQHAQVLVDEYAEVQRIAQEIGSLASQVGRVNPGDVSRSRADELARAASELLLGGGEEPPVLRRDPREPPHGERVEVEEAVA